MSNLKKERPQVNRTTKDARKISTSTTRNDQKVKPDQNTAKKQKPSKTQEVPRKPAADGPKLIKNTTNEIKVKSQKSIADTSKSTSKTLSKDKTELSKNISKQAKTSSNTITTKTTTNRSLDRPTVRREPVKPTPSSIRAIPLKASHKISLPIAAATPASSKNVMNQVHNVTVSSPPSKRREIATENDESVQKSDDTVQRDRTRTRTLEKGEIVLLKPQENPTKKAVEADKKQMTKLLSSQPVEPITVEIKQPVSFEIHFDEATDGNAVTDDRKTTVPQQKVCGIKNSADQQSFPSIESATDSKEPEKEDNVEIDEEDYYEDDFEAYESDFESEPGSSTPSGSSRSSVSSKSSSSLSDEKKLSENEEKTVIFHQAVKLNVDEDQQFDSGSFELKVLSAKKIVVADEPSEIQNDSGIDYNLNTSVQQTTSTQPSLAANLNSLETNNKTFDNISDIEVETTSLDNNIEEKLRKPFISKRGQDLMKKITLDTMSFVLFDFKPIPYERFMRIYGKLNTTQTSCQTHNNSVDQETQLTTIEVETRWTQSPATFYSKHIRSDSYLSYKNGCGKGDNDDDYRNADLIKYWNLDNSINTLNKYIRFSKNNSDGGGSVGGDWQTNSVLQKLNHDALSQFLQKKYLTVSQILNDRNRIRNLKQTDLPISAGYFTIDCSSYAEFRHTRVYGIVSNPSLPNFLFTLHENKEQRLYLVGVWNLGNISSPFCVLSSWTAITCIEIHVDVKNVIIGGLEDGSLALWNISEPHYWHPMLSEQRKRLIPSQLVTPAVQNQNGRSQDTGKVVSIRNIYSNIEFVDDCNPKQICSLHECGLLTLWTILLTSTNVDAVNAATKRIEHHSAWSTSSLSQSSIIDVRSLLMEKETRTRPTSAFEKNRSYFESELFNDKVLKELQVTQAHDEFRLNKPICTALEVTGDGIIIAINKNYLIFGRKSFKPKTFQKVQINAKNSSPIYFLASLEGGYDDDVILIGSKDGMVKTFCVETELKKIETTNESDEPSVSSSFSLPPAQNLLPKPSVSRQNVPFNSDNNADLVGKSCVIQNLVQGERGQTYDEAQMAADILDVNENKLPATANGNSNTPQILKLASFLNDPSRLLQNGGKIQMAHLAKSNKIVLLQREQLKIYDFLDSQEVSGVGGGDGSGCCSLTAIKGDNNLEYLVLLKQEDVIECHVIK